MKNKLLIGMLVWWGISCVCLSAKNTSDASVSEHCLPIADPYILYYNDCYYAYGTNARGFAVYISSDLKHWRRNATMALSPENSWGDKGYWAPEVYYIPSLNKFYMYYTVNEQVCVATSDSPEGPFVQDVKKPLWGVEKNIDPSLFIDSDGKAYLYFVRFTGGNVIWCAAFFDETGRCLLFALLRQPFREPGLCRRLRDGKFSYGTLEEICGKSRSAERFGRGRWTGRYGSWSPLPVQGWKVQICLSCPCEPGERATPFLLYQGFELER